MKLYMQIWSLTFWGLRIRSQLCYWTGWPRFWPAFSALHSPPVHQWREWQPHLSMARRRHWDHALIRLWYCAWHRTSTGSAATLPKHLSGLQRVRGWKSVNIKVGMGVSHTVGLPLMLIYFSAVTPGAKEKLQTVADSCAGPWGTNKNVLPGAKMTAEQKVCKPEGQGSLGKDRSQHVGWSNQTPQLPKEAI